MAASDVSEPRTPNEGAGSEGAESAKVDSTTMSNVVKHPMVVLLAAIVSAGGVSSIMGVASKDDLTRVETKVDRVIQAQHDHVSDPRMHLHLVQRVQSIDDRTKELGRRFEAQETASKRTEKAVLKICVKLRIDCD